jgi:hypothetical protein
LRDVGLSSLLRVGCCTRIKTCHGGYLRVGAEGGQDMVWAGDTKPENASIFWVQERDNKFPQECVFLHDLHKNFEQMRRDFLSFTGSEKEGDALCVFGKNQTSSIIRVAWAHEGRRQITLQVCKCVWCLNGRVGMSICVVHSKNFLLICV